MCVCVCVCVHGNMGGEDHSLFVCIFSALFLESKTDHHPVTRALGRRTALAAVGEAHLRVARRARAAQTGRKEQAESMRVFQRGERAAFTTERAFVFFFFSISYRSIKKAKRTNPKRKIRAPL